MLTFGSGWVNARLSKAVQWEAAPGTTSWWKLPLPARGRRREAACETVPEAEREDLPGKWAEKQACTHSGAATAAVEMRKAKQVLSSTRWFYQGANDQNTRGPRAGCRSFIRFGYRLSFTVNNYKPETSNRRLPSLHFFSDWLVPQTHDGNLRLTEVHVWAQMHRLWLF